MNESDKWYIANDVLLGIGLGAIWMLVGAVVYVIFMVFAAMFSLGGIVAHPYTGVPLVWAVTLTPFALFFGWVPGAIVLPFHKRNSAIIYAISLVLTVFNCCANMVSFWLTKAPT